MGVSIVVLERLMLDKNVGIEYESECGREVRGESSGQSGCLGYVCSGDDSEDSLYRADEVLFRSFKNDAYWNG